MESDNQELLHKIEEGFSAVHKSENIFGRKNWTVAFFDVLKKVGLGNNFKVYSSSTSEMIPERNGGGEWLYDLIWSKEGKDKNSWKQGYMGLKLICESEWDKEIDAILYDFLKLTVGKAEIKIMIVQFDSIEKFGNIIEALEQSVDQSLYTDGSIYILVGSSENLNQIQWVELWTK